MTTQPINSAASLSLKGAKSVGRFLEQERDKSQKAHKTAMRVEAFRLRREMKSDIKKGAPGGRAFVPLSYIARRMMRKVHGEGGAGVRQSPNRKPLSRLHTAVRYSVASVTPFVMKVGFVGHGGGMNQISSTWRRIAEQQQIGFTRLISRQQRRAIVGRGDELGTVDSGSTPFFLRKSTKQFSTPARPIVEPFWVANKSKATRNIQRNFKLKMVGKRI